MKNMMTLLSLLTLFLSKAQVLDEYPQKQAFYEGGIVNFYKEAHEYLTSNKSTECSSNEIYQPRILVTNDGEVKLVKDYDTLNIAKNKCAYDLAMGIIKNLKHWKPAEVKGAKFGAITEFVIYPQDLMSNYKIGYNAYDFIKSAQYSAGAAEFKKEFHDNFMALFEDYHINGDLNLEFYINKEGHIVNPRIYPAVRDQSFNVNFMRTLSRLKKEWKPALYGNIPIKQRVALPMDFSITFRER